MEELISIIVPIYKVEAYLDRCIESIVDQTYKNLEIILVDDGSPDGCPQICDNWKEKDDRIKVIHKENGGLSDARNAGMQIMTGTYVSYVDSDDWIAKICMKRC
ncbi:MAG: glycosyltransferase family 2 protein [Anaerostipes sp.]